MGESVDSFLQVETISNREIKPLMYNIQDGTIRVLAKKIAIRRKCSRITERDYLK